MSILKIFYPTFCEVLRHFEIFDVRTCLSHSLARKCGPCSEITKAEEKNHRNFLNKSWPERNHPHSVPVEIAFEL